MADEIISAEEIRKNREDDELTKKIDEAVAKALREFDPSRPTKETVVTSGTLDEQIKRSVESAVTAAVAAAMKKQKEEDEKCQVPSREEFMLSQPQGMTNLPMIINDRNSKPSGWETFGKVALGGAITAAVFGIVAKLAGGDDGSVYID